MAVLHSEEKPSTVRASLPPVRPRAFQRALLLAFTAYTSLSAGIGTGQPASGFPAKAAFRRDSLSRAAEVYRLPSLRARQRSFVERLDQGFLAAVRRDVQALSRQARPAQRPGSLRDFRCVFHAHSRLSHDSTGTPQELAAGAKSARVRAVFMTEHPTPDRRWVTRGLSGLKHGVLFVPGAELSDGLSLWRSEAAPWTPEMLAGEVLSLLQGTAAVAVVCHSEKRTEDADWNLPPFAGMEIYNSHADVDDNNVPAALAALVGNNPLKLIELNSTLKKYPQEAFAAIFDEQVAVLERWDSLNSGLLGTGRHVVGIAGNDSHQNVKPLGRYLDPYPVSFHYVSTHVLAAEVSETSLLDAMQRGRAYVAFDWIADPTGFTYTADAGGQAVEMGGEASLSAQPLLSVRTDLPCQIRLLRNGVEVLRTTGTSLTYNPQEPGVYRAEAWVTVAGTKRPWIYSNPIYVLP